MLSLIFFSISREKWNWELRPESFVSLQAYRQLQHSDSCTSSTSIPKHLKWYTLY